jgi:hypothetical protein
MTNPDNDNHDVTDVSDGYGDSVVTINGRQYPSIYPPGSHWSADEAWRVLDMIKPGVLSLDVRSMLAGAIAGLLMKVSREADAKLTWALESPLSPLLRKEAFDILKSNSSKDGRVKP